MNNKTTYIFTECVNTGRICGEMLRSYFKTHPENKFAIFVFGTPRDFEEIGKVDGFYWEIDITSNNYPFEKGHEGTANVFASAIDGFVFEQRQFQKPDYLIHIDSDVIFLKESISHIINKFNEGYAIAGTRRCYKNNPGKAPVYEGAHDTVSTYFMGVETKYLRGIDINKLSRMCQGAENPLGFPVLDFFDGCTFYIKYKGGNICYLNEKLFGGQNEFGKKDENGCELNLHMDSGKNLIHFGGVGSGLAYHLKRSNPEKSYAEWALGRYNLFNNMFFNQNILGIKPCVYGDDGRWIDGNFDKNIYALLKNKLK